MNIGFDAKRAYHNNTGLGFFSRVLIRLLADQYPEHTYYLFNPRPGKSFQPNQANIREVLPKATLHRLLSAAWRSRWVTRDLTRMGINLYHGLSHEIPAGLPQTGIPSVVTIHDLFPEIYPEQYKPIDVKIYRAKLRYACGNATRIMAISEETKNHIIKIYGTDPGKIDVIYQSCAPAFMVPEPEEKKEAVRQKYQLPEAFFLHVGTIIERKNLLNICKALNSIRNDIPIPLVVVGNDGGFKDKVKAYLKEAGLEDRVCFLSEQLALAGKKPFVATEDLPALYQLATAMIYPSYFEGFGMPIIEAMAGGVPVITATTSCLPEIAGNAAWLADPDSPEEMANGFRKIYSDAAFAAAMRQRGLENAQRFRPEVYAGDVMKLYQSIL
ncbi:Glycosyltransferase involved in cell wall bisynthesis [Niabella drilacis]|uniref:Glycosyltransferase involved in cell wall bisynthesis n=2 Tax=Niabella drilacis (strain DSM 25811 / CCM 8410 / CCUG 62505 / LMG 26954 / E90) TaxID=1285928 RepID=A0A1G6NL70_NIADE|nr:Glycosyltransferase involved in cell wall bisynthesis [Niabella drilacis]